MINWLKENWRKIIQITLKWVFFIILFIIFIFIFSDSDTICEKTLQYSVGNFDERFGITKEEFINVIKDAEKIWEEPMKLNLFDYEPNAQFKINLVFSEEQKEFIERSSIKEKIENNELSIDRLDEEYESLSFLYDQKLNNYNNSLYAYEERLNLYNSKIDYWNNIGGAPKNIYYSLEKEREKLDSLAFELESDRISVNELGDKLDILAERSNHSISQFNTSISTYNAKFGEAKEFDQADYKGNEINIYQFNEINDLNLVLIHELGHALELDHTENPESIMYYLMDEQNIVLPKLTQEDIEALKTKCNLK
ncbi:MAG: matrixin family metalloprotease [Spirochaetota bacterium]